MAKVSKSFRYGNHDVTLETGEIARQARRRRHGQHGRHRRARHGRRRDQGARRPGFLPAHRRLPGKVLLGRPHSRRLLQARRPPDRKGDADFAPHRSSGAPAVPRGVQERSAGHRDRALDESRDRRRHSRADRRVGRADAGRHAVQGPDRRRARRLRERPVPPQSDARRSSRRPISISSSPAPPTRC